MSKVLRVPKLDLPAVLAQQNPQIDLRLEAYEASTRNFLKAVSNYTQRAVTEITNRKNGFAAEKKKIAEKTTQIETETNQSKLREIELIAGAFRFVLSLSLLIRPAVERSARQGAGGEEGKRSERSYIPPPTRVCQGEMRVARRRNRTAPYHHCQSHAWYVYCSRSIPSAFPQRLTRHLVR